MKKTLIATAILLLIASLGVSAQSITIVNNSSSCQAKVFLFAHDAVNTTCASIESKPYQLFPMTNLSFTSLANSEDPSVCGSGSGRGWFVPSSSYCSTAPGYWDAAEVVIGGSGGTFIYYVGEMCSGNPLSTSGTDCTGLGTINVVWDNSNYPNIVIKIF